eukprot:scaffold202169_cov19-Prasinocladus_malaysianus.AAC.2
MAQAMIHLLQQLYVRADECDRWTMTCRRPTTTYRQASGTVRATTFRNSAEGKYIYFEAVGTSS